MNYRWVFMGLGLVVLGLFICLLYKSPVSWFVGGVVSVSGLILFFFGYVIKRHDRYAEGRLPLKSRL